MRYWLLIAKSLLQVCWLHPDQVRVAQAMCDVAIRSVGQLDTSGATAPAMASLYGAVKLAKLVRSS